MIRHGKPPYLECSGRGDMRLSAFYAKPSCLNGKSIEEAYQAAKILPDGTTGHTWREAKGKKAINAAFCASLYSDLWDSYIAENPKLLTLICEATGLSDTFGQPGHVCQATELWRIRNHFLLMPKAKGLF